MKGLFVAILVAAVLVGLAAAKQAAAGDDLVLLVFKKHCLDTLLNDHAIPDMACLKFTLSKVLGYGVVTGAAIVKLPQIISIVRAGFVSNLSRTAVYLELLCGLWACAYNFLKGNPFSTYGESVFIVVQNCALVLLLWAYADKKEAPSALERMAVVAGLAAASAAPFYLPTENLEHLFMAQTVIFTTSRMPQVYANFAEGHTGSSAGLTLFMNFAGTCARVFTSLQEVSDPLVAINFMINAAVNAVLFFQYIWFRSATAAHLAAVAKEHAAANGAKDTKKTQ